MKAKTMTTTPAKALTFTKSPLENGLYAAQNDFYRFNVYKSSSNCWSLDVFKLGYREMPVYRVTGRNITREALQKRAQQLAIDYGDHIPESDEYKAYQAQKAEDEKETAKGLIKRAIAAAKTEYFTKGYQASDTEALGIALSNAFEWTVNPILKTAAAALEDSNWHTGSNKILELLAQLEND
jgi:hypothetical protein